MKIENVQLVMQRIEELQNLDNQRARLYELREKQEDQLRLYINSWRDGSGITVEPIYRDGNLIPGFYHDILETVIQRFDAYREQLVKEIEEL